MVKDDNDKLNHYVKNNAGLKNKISCPLCLALNKLA